MMSWEGPNLLDTRKGWLQGVAEVREGRLHFCLGCRWITPGRQRAGIGCAIPPRRFDLRGAGQAQLQFLR